MLIEPVDLLFAQHEYATKDNLRNALGMRLRVSKRQRAAPRTSKNLPLFDLEGSPQNLDVVDQIPGRVVFEAGMRGAFAASPLIKKDDSVDIGIPETTHVGSAPATRPAMQKNHRLAMRNSAFLVIEPVAAANLQVSGVIRFNRRIKLAPCRVCRHGGIMKGTRPECYSY